MKTYVPIRKTHDPRCVLDPLHHRETPCSWFVPPARPTQADVLTWRLRDLLDNDEEFAALYRDAEADQRNRWTYEPAPLFELAVTS